MFGQPISGWVGQAPTRIFFFVVVVVFMFPNVSDQSEFFSDFWIFFNLTKPLSNASLNPNIYATEDPTPVDVEHAAHACRCISCSNVYSANNNDPRTLISPNSFVSV